mmetsp:Transcript_33651/g.99895  ORF Transcript_33651/g.99895 Transcript_33651/m.99895 type:complete len:506 (-) Transcript_33651:32-1549(-)
MAQNWTARARAETTGERAATGTGRPSAAAPSAAATRYWPSQQSSETRSATFSSPSRGSFTSPKGTGAPSSTTAIRNSVCERSCSAADARRRSVRTGIPLGNSSGCSLCSMGPAHFLTVTLYTLPSFPWGISAEKPVHGAGFWKGPSLSALSGCASRPVSVTEIDMPAPSRQVAQRTTTGASFPSSPSRARQTKRSCGTPTSSRDLSIMHSPRLRLTICTSIRARPSRCFTTTTGVSWTTPSRPTARSAKDLDACSGFSLTPRVSTPAISGQRAGVSMSGRMATLTPRPKPKSPNAPATPGALTTKWKCVLRAPSSRPSAVTLSPSPPKLGKQTTWALSAPHRPADGTGLRGSVGASRRGPCATEHRPATIESCTSGGPCTVTCWLVTIGPAWSARAGADPSRFSSEGSNLPCQESPTPPECSPTATVASSARPAPRSWRRCRPPPALTSAGTQASSTPFSICSSAGARNASVGAASAISPSRKLPLRRWCRRCEENAEVGSRAES